MLTATKIIENLLSSNDTLKRESLRQDFVMLSIEEKKTVENRLIELLKDETIDPAIRSWVPSFLGPIRTENVYYALLTHMPEERSDTVRRWIVRTLVNYFNRDECIIAIIKQLDRESSIPNKKYIIKSLGESGSILAVPKFIEYIKNYSVDVRIEVAKGLGHIQSKQAVKPLIQQLTIEEVSHVGEEIIDTLVSLGDSEAIPTLKEIIQNNQKPIRLHISAINALGSLASSSDKEIIQLLIQQSCNSNRIISFSATDAILKLIPQEEAAIRLAKYGIQCDDATRVYVASAIRLVGVKPAIDYLKTIEDPTQVSQAQNLLEHIGGPEAVDVLVERRISALNIAKNRVEEFDKQGLTIFKDTIKKAKLGFDLNLWMSVIIFVVGIGILLLSFYIIITPNSNLFQQVFGVGSGLAGLGTILTMFYYGPSDRINRAVTNLVQIEIAFLSYIRQITQIMAMFEREYLEDDFNITELKKLLDYIERTIKETMPLVHKYTLDSSIKKEGKGEETAHADIKSS